MSDNPETPRKKAALKVDSGKLRRAVLDSRQVKCYNREHYFNIGPNITLQT